MPTQPGNDQLEVPKCRFFGKRAAICTTCSSGTAARTISGAAGGGPNRSGCAGSIGTGKLLQRAAVPSGRRSMNQLVRGPVVLVELEGDHLGRVVPGNGLQAQR